MKYVQISGDTATVTVEGQFQLVQSITVGSELGEAYNKGATKVVFDFAKTRYIDSSAVTELIKAWRKMGKDNFVIHNPNTKVAAVLRGANLMGWVK